MSLKRDRFYRDWYRPRRRLDRGTTIIVTMMAVFAVVAMVMTQCIHESPVPAKAEAKNVHYQMLDGDKIIRVTDDSVQIADYWEF